MFKTLAGVVCVPVAGAAAFASLSPSGEVHEVDRFTAYRTLKAMSFDELGPEFRQAGGGVRTTGVPGQEVVWTVTALGGKVATVRAVLEPVDDAHTRVTMATHSYDHPDATVNTDLIRTAVRYGLEEKIDASLDGRAFDVEQLKRRMAAYVVANPASVVAARRSVTDGEHEFVQEEMMREAAPSGPYDPAEGVREREREAARRMAEASAPTETP